MSEAREGDEEFDDISPCPGCGEVGHTIQVWTEGVQLMQCPQPRDECRVDQYYPEETADAQVPAMADGGVETGKGSREQAEMKERMKTLMKSLGANAAMQSQRPLFQLRLDKWLPWREYRPWVDLFEHATKLWEDPDEFEAGGHTERWKEGHEYLWAFEMGVLFGIEYEQAYPEGRNDEWPIPLDERPSRSEGANNEGSDLRTDGGSPEDDAGEETVQDILEQSMPDFPEDRREMPDDDEFRMTNDEMDRIHGLFDGLVHTLYDRGYTPNELGVIVHGINHRMNASRYDPHEYDRIALTLQIRETIETWRDEQDPEVPAAEVATAVEELGRMYRHEARRKLYRDDGDGDEDGGEAGESDGTDGEVRTDGGRPPERGLLQYHEPESWRFYVYGEDAAGDPLFSFYMNITDNTGVCLYDRNEGGGKYHWTTHDPDEYEGVPPSEGFKQVIDDAVGDDPGVAREDVQALPDHEEYFFRSLHGTLDQKGKIPDELFRFIVHCTGREVRLE